MESAATVHGLPPSKRFKLLHSFDPHIQNPKSLPAKKRADLRDGTSPICLPAKKRVWAPLPLSPIKTPPPPVAAVATAEEMPVKEAAVEAEAVAVAVEEEEEEEDDDDGVVCAVCRSTDGDPSDPIVFCDGCDLMVHALCYGSPLARSIPEGDWFCLRCEDMRKEKKNNTTESAPDCCLCPTGGGAVKPTVGGEWAHITCSLLVPEVFFHDPEGRDGIDCSGVPERRRRKRCYVCGSCRGCAIECSEPKCELGFHVSCGLDEGLCIEYREGKRGAVVAGFCGDHTKLWEKQQLTGKFRIVAREDAAKRKARA